MSTAAPSAFEEASMQTEVLTWEFWKCTDVTTLLVFSQLELSVESKQGTYGAVLAAASVAPRIRADNEAAMECMIMIWR